MEKEITKADGMQSKLQEVLMNIESTQADVEVFNALKQGDQVLTDLQNQVKMEDWDELYERHQDQKERDQMEVDMFGEALDDDALANELDALEAEDVAGKMDAPIATGTIAQADADKYREANGISAAADPEPAEAAAPKRQLVAA